MPGEAAALTWRPRLRVLCLHGRQQTAATFRHKIAKLAAKVESYAEFVFVDGPVELELQEGAERENVRGWWPKGSGSRSPEEDVAVLDVLRSAWSELGPFDGVLGFSEGTAAGLEYCRMAEASDAEAAPAGGGLRFAIFVGGYVPTKADAAKPPLKLPSLHVASKGDTCVSFEDSRELAKLFAGAQFWEHGGAHVVPQGAEDIRRVGSFLDAQRSEIYSPDACGVLPEGSEVDPRIAPDQLDELEALEAMLTPDEWVRLAPAFPVRLALRLAGGEASLRLTLPAVYPLTAQSICELSTENFGLLAHKDEILAAAEEAREPLGFPCVLQMYQAAQQWIEEHEEALAARAALGGASAAAASADAGEDDDATDDAPKDAWWRREDEELDAGLLEKAERTADALFPSSGSAAGAWARECGAGGYGKPWEFIVGLVGKPSAGKSTLFNAATRPDRPDREASMAPHPFTTIDPNVSPGWFAAPCPAEQLGRASASPEHGRVGGRVGGRRHPLLVKDVAGLVPGAYLGRGRGNAFLNDLCDADSLIHVVDASGRSDREGVQGANADGASAGKGGTDPLDEVGWVRREIHMWIFCNVKAKWDSVRRLARVAKQHGTRDAVADRLFGLFTGYRASRQLAAHVYEAAGYSLHGLDETIVDWQEYDLHLLVACFLRARFPITVALNKADVPEAKERVAKAKEALGPSAVIVSARSEWWLYEQQRLEHLTYAEGGGADSVKLSDAAPEAVRQQWERVRAQVLEPYGGTGVLEALSMAVQRRRPVFFCPVADFAGFASLQRHNGPLAAELSTLLMLRPQSTVEEAYAALKHEQMLRGDFVRAETLGPDGQVRVHRRDEILRGEGDKPQALVLRVLTNKKAK